MTESILQNYLTAQHIRTSDQANVDNLKKAVTVIKNLLVKKKQRIIPFALVAMDPNISGEDPIVQEVEILIIKKWPAFKNSVTATSDKSTTYVRAVILDAFRLLANSDIELCAIIWHTVRDIASHSKLGSEKEVIISFLNWISNKVESAAHDSWGIPGQNEIVPIDDMHLEIQKPTKVSSSGLHDELTAAFENSARGGENPGHVFQNNYTWIDFAPHRAATGIASEVNSALTDSFNSLEDGINNWKSQIEPIFNRIAEIYEKQSIATNKRSELLWWKQTLYSRSLSESYRNKSLLDNGILMSIDLAEMVSGVYPLSVDYLLRETLWDLCGEEVDQKKKLAHWLEDFDQVDHTIRGSLAKYSEAYEGRQSILVEMVNFIENSNPEQFYASTGLNANTEISVSELSVWLFHSLQADKLAKTK